MKKIELLPLADAVKSAILKTDTAYRRFKKIRTDILEIDGDTVTVRVEQFETNGSAPLTAQELISNGKDIFSHAPALKIRWRPLVFEGSGMDAVGPDWVRSMLKKKDITQQQLADDLGIDKHVMSKLLSGNYEFTKWHRAAFWFYFK